MTPLVDMLAAERAHAGLEVLEHKEGIRPVHAHRDHILRCFSLIDELIESDVAPVRLLYLFGMKDSALVATLLGYASFPMQQTEKDADSEEHSPPKCIIDSEVGYRALRVLSKLFWHAAAPVTHHSTSPEPQPQPPTPSRGRARQKQTAGTGNMSPGSQSTASASTVATPISTVSRDLRFQVEYRGALLTTLLDIQGVNILLDLLAPPSNDGSSTVRAAEVRQGSAEVLASIAHAGGPCLDVLTESSRLQFLLSLLDAAVEDSVGLRKCVAAILRSSVAQRNALPLLAVPEAVTVLLDVWSLDPSADMRLIAVETLSHLVWRHCAISSEQLIQCDIGTIMKRRISSSEPSVEVVGGSLRLLEVILRHCASSAGNEASELRKSLFHQVSEQVTAQLLLERAASIQPVATFALRSLRVLVETSPPGDQIPLGLITSFSSFSWLLQRLMDECNASSDSVDALQVSLLYRSELALCVGICCARDPAVRIWIRKELSTLPVWRSQLREALLASLDHVDESSFLDSPILDEYTGNVMNAVDANSVHPHVLATAILREQRKSFELLSLLSEGKPASKNADSMLSLKGAWPAKGWQAVPGSTATPDRLSQLQTHRLYRNLEAQIAFSLVKQALKSAFSPLTQQFNDSDTTSSVQTAGQSSRTTPSAASARQTSASKQKKMASTSVSRTPRSVGPRNHRQPTGHTSVKPEMAPRRSQTQSQSQTPRGTNGGGRPAPVKVHHASQAQAQAQSNGTRASPGRHGKGSYPLVPVSSEWYLPKEPKGFHTIAPTSPPPPPSVISPQRTSPKSSICTVAFVLTKEDFHLRGIQEASRRLLKLHVQVKKRLALLPLGKGDERRSLTEAMKAVDDLNALLSRMTALIETLGEENLMRMIDILGVSSITHDNAMDVLDDLEEAAREASHLLALTAGENQNGAVDPLAT